MSNNKQSSVEWLIEKYTIVCGLGSKELMKEHIDRAKAMHKQEINQAWKMGDGKFDNVAKDMSWEYYNETYAGGEQ